LAIVLVVAVLPGWTLTQQDAIGLFLAFFSFALLYAGAESMLDSYRRKHRMALSKLEELKLGKYDMRRQDVLRLAMYELALSGRLAAFVLGYPSLDLSQFSVMTLAVITGVLAMAALNVTLIHDYVTGEKFVMSILNSLSEKDAANARYAYAAMYFGLAGFSFVTTWQVGASLATVLLALDVLVVFNSAQSFIHHFGIRSEYRAMGKLTEEFRDWVIKERPSFDSAHAAYLRLESGEADWKGGSAVRGV
jgi:hypothetical protein